MVNIHYSLVCRVMHALTFFPRTGKGTERNCTCPTHWACRNADGCIKCPLINPEGEDLQKKKKKKKKKKLLW